MKRMIAIFLVYAMLISALPLMAQAAEDSTRKEELAELLASGDCQDIPELSYSITQCKTEAPKRSTPDCSMLPGITMVGQNCLTNSACHFQMLQYYFGASQSYFVFIYKGTEIESDNLVARATGNYPTAIGSRLYTLTWDTPSAAGSYLMVLGTSTRSGSTIITYLKHPIVLTDTPVSMTGIGFYNSDMESEYTYYTMSIGQEFDGRLNVYPSNTTSCRCVTVTSDNNSVAEVEEGRAGYLQIVAKGVGTARITARTDEGFTSHLTINVTCSSHKAKTVAGYAATCEEPGLTDGTVCSVCGQVLQTQQVIPALGHSWSNWATTKEACCTEDGLQERTCGRCYKAERVVIPATGHQHEEFINYQAPTCTESGMQEYICTACGFHVTETLSALGHDWGKGELTVAPTETTPGVKLYTCNRCAATKTEEIPVLPKFNDIPENAWYVEAVNYVVGHGLMNGVGSGRFKPDGTMTRAMLVTVLWRYAGEPKEGVNSFSDVQDGLWYTDAVAWAAKNGIVTGVAEGRFNPEGNISREQMATILYRYAGTMGLDMSKRADLAGFPDAGSVSSWAKDAMQWCVAEGIIGGSDGKLLPQGNATRAQVAAILMRFIENAVK